MSKRDEVARYLHNVFGDEWDANRRPMGKHADAILAILTEPSDRMVEAACDALVDYIDSITMLHDAEEADMMRAAIRASMQAAGE